MIFMKLQFQSNCSSGGGEESQQTESLGDRIVKEGKVLSYRSACCKRVSAFCLLNVYECVCMLRNCGLSVNKLFVCRMQMLIVELKRLV